MTFFYLYFMMMMIILPRAQSFCWSCPPGPQFSAAAKQQQLAMGAGVLPAIEACVASGARTCSPLPPGDYRFPLVRTGYQLELRGLRRPASNPLTLDLRGVTFWFTMAGLSPSARGPAGALSLHLYNCSNLVIEGLTVDADPRGSIEGRVVEIDARNNRALLAISDGSYFAPVANASDSWLRFILFTDTGEHMAPLYPLQRIRGLSAQSLSPLDALNQSWISFLHDTLLNLSADAAWNSAYGSLGALRPGSGVALLSSFGQGISFDKSVNLTLRNSSNFAVKQGLTFWGGDGGHVVSGFYSGPRPGTNQLLGGDGCNNNAARVGATIDNSTFVTSTDDLLNFHSTFAAIVGVTGRTLLFEPDDPRDGGDGPSSYTVGAARVGDAVEIYDAASSLLATAVVAAVINSSALTLIDLPPGNLSGTFALFPEGCGANWRVTNSRFINMFQRILIMTGPGTFSNNTVIREGSGINVGSLPAGARTASGIPHGIDVIGNTFVDTAPAPHGTLAAVYPIELGDATDPTVLLGRGFVIADNVIQRAGSNAIMAANAKGVVVRKNTFVNPLLYTFLANGTHSPSVPWQAVYLLNSSDVDIDGNTLDETPPGVCTPDTVTKSRMLGLGGANSNVTLDGFPVI
jgi:hypothetical protein